MTNARDEQMMRRALALAERGWGQTAPNPMVGAVVVSGEAIVGEGHHERFGGAHAEVNALRVAGAAARGATMYVTLEPCNHHGKTPPCVDAIIAAGVARVVAATRDPGTHSGGGATRLEESGIPVTLGVLERDARELNAPFFHAAVARRPWVTLKLAVSVDGAVSDARRSRGWLSNALSRREVHRLRAGSDAIAVGAGTYIADRPALTVRDGFAPRVAPQKIVFDSNDALAAVGVEVPADVTVVRDEHLPQSLEELGARGIRSLLVEGGASLASAMLDADVVDRLVIFQTPIILGGGSLAAFAAARSRTIGEAPRMEVLRRESFGDDAMTTYAIHAV